MKYEFKGTKGKWLARIHFGIDVVRYDEDFGICDIGYVKELEDANYPLDEAKYNALLIAKSPEMFEMLKECLSYFECQNIEVQNTIAIKQIRKLLKQATEI